MTTGQSIVAKWEALDSPWSEPADLAEAIDKAISAEREACAKLAEGEINGDFRSWPHQPGDYDNVCVQSKLADAIAAAIRARST